jgi:TrmH family RNA methyltransferase
MVLGQITSLQNTLIKETRKLQQKKYRELENQYLIEGIRLVEEARKRGSLGKVFYDHNLGKTPRGLELLKKISKTGTPLYQVTPEILASLADTESPQGIVAVVNKESNGLWQLKLGDQSMVLIIDGLQDPGNLGTIIRTAWAVGVDGILCLTGTVDPYNSKTIRATMGGIFQVPVVTDLKWSQVHQWCQENHFQTVAGDLSAVKNHYAVTYSPRVAFILGNEGQGLQTVNLSEVHELVRIPLWGEAESLNVAVAAGILLYEAVRQRAYRL